MKITATIIAQDEEAKIGTAIRSVSWADEVLVVDSRSTDRTQQIARDLGAKLLIRDWPGFSAQKQFAVDSAENDWILSLDADEEVSPALREEILSLSRGGDFADGYRIPRLSFYMHRPIRHSGWYPDRQLRLFDRRRARWKVARVHESVELFAPGARVAELAGEIFHRSVDSAAHHHRMIGERYAPLSARQMHENGRRSSPLRIAAAGPAEFLRSYILKAGFLDGLPGYCISRFAAHHAYLKYLMLWELQNAPTDTPDPETK